MVYILDSFYCVKLAVTIDGDYFEYAGKWTSNRIIAIEAVKTNYRLIQHVPKELWLDKNVKFAALENAMQSAIDVQLFLNTYFDCLTSHKLIASKIVEALQYHKDLAMAIVYKYPYFFFELAIYVQADRDVLLAAMHGIYNTLCTMKKELQIMLHKSVQEVEAILSFLQNSSFLLHQLLYSIHPLQQLCNHDIYTINLIQQFKYIYDVSSSTITPTQSFVEVQNNLPLQ